MVNAFVLDGTTLDASPSREVWWEDHHGLEIWRLALIVLVTISNSYFVYMLLDY